MKSGYILAALAAFTLAAPAMAGDKDQKSDKDGQSAQEAPKEKKVCHTETVTGSLISKQRICKTQAEWDEIAANTRKTLGDYNRRENVGADNGSASGANNNAGFGF
jgi:hypothetical protein